MMNVNGIKIRTATADDTEALLEIYAPYVKNTAITFEYDVPSVAEFQKRIEETLVKYPYFLAENKEGILGYAYASAFHERAAYEWAAEISVYLKMDARGQGIGRRLYEEIESILKAQNIININACIAYTEVQDEYLTQASVKFHERMGYKLVGHFHKCGYKFQRWYDMVWMEKIIGNHETAQPQVIPFNKLYQQNTI